MSNTADLIVVGGGAGGLTAAREGLRRGARTVLIQDGAPGGDCTFTGCVPSKTLLAAGRRGDSFEAAMASVSRTVNRIASSEDALTLQSEGIEVVNGRGSFVDGHTLSVQGKNFRAPRIIIATGSRAALPPIEGIEAAEVLTNETLFGLTDLPGRLAILGGGPVGCEMAQAFTLLGAEVTLLEARDRLLPRDEPEVAQVVRRVLERQGVDVRTGAAVTMIDRQPASNRSVVSIGDVRPVEADQVLVAAGRQPVTTGLDVRRAGLRLDRRGALQVADTMATNAPGVWAVGDVTGGMQFTHAAGRMAMVAVANAFGRRVGPRQHFDERTVPWVTYLDPEVAHVGMGEAEAARHGGRVAWLPLEETDRALTEGHTDGFVKLIAGPRRVVGNLGGGRLLGATIVAPRAGEMIHEIVLAMHTKLFTGRLVQAVHAYPTWSMAIQEAAAQFFSERRGRAARSASASVDGIRP